MKGGGIYSLTRVIKKIAIKKKKKIFTATQKTYLLQFRILFNRGNFKQGKKKLCENN